MRITTCSQSCLNLLTLCLLAGLGGSSIWGQEASVLATENPTGIRWEKGSVRLGAFFGSFDSNIGFVVGRESQLLVNGEDTLGLPSTLTVFRADALYRIGKARKHQVDFSYAGYRRNGQTTLTDPVDTGGRVVIPATRIDSVLNFAMIRLSYTYAFVQSDHVRIGGGLSAYVLPIEYGLKFAIGDTPPSLAPRSLIVPVPALALRADFRIWHDLYMTSDFNGVYLELFGFEGSLFDASVAIEYRPCPRDKQRTCLYTRSYNNLAEQYGFYFHAHSSWLFGSSSATTASRTIPGEFGARASGLVEYLDSRHYGVELSEEDFRRIVLWLDCNSEFLGAYEDADSQALGKLIMPGLN